jgi:hypothetical protein
MARVALKEWLMKSLVRSVAGPASVLLLALGPRSVAALSDVIFQNNCEPAPDCSSVGAAGCPGFAIETPALEVAAGGEAQYCYYFRTPAAGTLGIGRFSSTFGSPVHHFIVYTTVDNLGAPVDARPPGTFQANCGFSSGANGTNPRWLYAAHAAAEVMRMPDDDGSGNPLAVEIPGNTAGFFEILYINNDVQAATAPAVRWLANGLADGVVYTTTASLMTFTVAINIGAGTVQNPTPGGAIYTCPVPDSVKFWRFTTQTHHFSVGTVLSNSVNHSTLQASADWELPAIATPPAPFYSFNSGAALSVSCSYLNPEAHTVVTGDSYALDETCVAVAHFFPAASPQFCISTH